MELYRYSGVRYRCRIPESLQPSLARLNQQIRLLPINSRVPSPIIPEIPRPPIENEARITETMSTPAWPYRIQEVMSLIPECVTPFWLIKMPTLPSPDVPPTENLRLHRTYQHRRFVNCQTTKELDAFLLELEEEVKSSGQTSKPLHTVSQQSPRPIQFRRRQLTYVAAEKSRKLALRSVIYHQSINTSQVSSTRI